MARRFADCACLGLLNMCSMARSYIGDVLAAARHTGLVTRLKMDIVRLRERESRGLCNVMAETAVLIIATLIDKSNETVCISSLSYLYVYDQ